MCGIAGVVGLGAEESRVTVDSQLELLHHRGPDARGVYARSQARLAQNRLAIIDLRTGDPPIMNEDGAVGCVLNGEIYNFHELRAALSAREHVFHTQGDTEVLAHLAEELDAAALARSLHGMFAFGVWNERNATLTLGRDRVGKKPLYYWCNGRTLVFGSEIKAVLVHPLVRRELDPAAIPAYLAFGYVPTPRTFFQGIRSVPPAHVLTWTPGAEVELHRYWKPDALLTERTSVGREDWTLTSAAKEVRHELERAVRNRLIADVPLGAFLSGGLDSSAIVAITAGPLGQQLPTFTIGFDDRQGYDERPYARAVAKRYGTDHHEFVVQPDAVELLERLVWLHDQPFGDSSAIPTFLLSEATREHVTVALSGDGGDEVFAGYERFIAALALTRYGRVPRSIRSLGRRLLGSVPATLLSGRIGSLQRFVGSADLGMPDAYLEWVGFLDRELRRRAVGETADEALDEYRQIWASSFENRPLDRLLDLNLRTYLPDDLLVKADRMSMAHGLEVRSPLLDIGLIELAQRFPPQLKLRGLARKRVLALAVRDLLPPSIRRRRKRGFGVPLDRWFREDLQPYLKSMLGVSTSRVRQHLSPQCVDGMIADHLAGRREHGQALWALLTLEVFLRREGW